MLSSFIDLYSYLLERGKTYLILLLPLFLHLTKAEQVLHFFKYLLKAEALVRQRALILGDCK